MSYYHVCHMTKGIYPPHRSRIITSLQNSQSIKHDSWFTDDNKTNYLPWASLPHQTMFTAISGLVAIFSYFSPLVASTTGGAGYDTSRVGPSNAICERKLYELEISSNNIVYVPELSPTVNEVYNHSLIYVRFLYWLEQTVMTRVSSDLIIGLVASSSASNFSTTYEKGKKLINNTYSLSGTLCTPKHGLKNKEHVQLLIHGISWDSGYVVGICIMVWSVI